jgi:hypothetical protein
MIIINFAKKLDLLTKISLVEKLGHISFPIECDRKGKFIIINNQETELKFFKYKK